jgi:hypothetical protein
MYAAAPVPGVHEKVALEALNWLPGAGAVITAATGVPASVKV